MVCSKRTILGVNLAPNPTFRSWLVLQIVLKSDNVYFFVLNVLLRTELFLGHCCFTWLFDLHYADLSVQSLTIKRVIC